MKFSLTDFEKFEAPSGRTTPFLTLDANARMYFSSGAIKSYKISAVEYKAAQLFFNRVSNVIAVKLLSEGVEGSIPLKFSQQGGGFINSKSFALHHEMMNGDKLSEEFKGKYLLEKGEIDGVGEVFFIKLSEKK